MSTPAESWTIGRVLTWSSGYLKDKGFETALLDSQLLLAHALGCDRLKLYLDYPKPLKADELAAFKTLLKRRLAHEPIAYILETRAFWTLDLAVGPGVLIPRPETETLVEAALERLDGSAPVKVLEAGVGSGAVTLALASERPRAAFTATDLSPDALVWARRNAETAGLADRIEFLTGDLLTPLAGRRFDMILMNPPYISRADYRDLAPEIRNHEPVGALEAGQDGLDVVRRLIADAPAHLEPGGWLLMEIGWDQGRAVRDLLAAGPYTAIDILPDLGRRDRVATARLDREA